MARHLFRVSTYAPTLAHTSKARMLAQLVGFLQRCVCQVPENMPYWENAPSLIGRSCALVTLYKAPWNIYQKRNTNQPLTFGTFQPNFRELSGAFGIQLYVRKFYYAWLLLLHIQMTSGCAFWQDEFSSKSIPNFQNDCWILTKWPMLVLNA